MGATESRREKGCGCGMRLRLRPLLITIIAAVSLPVQGQTVPDAPSVRMDEHVNVPVSLSQRAFWATVGAYTAGIVADDWTTQRYERMGCVEVWNPGLYGHRPGSGRFLGVSFGIEAGEVAGIWVGTQRRKSRLLRWSGVGAVGRETTYRWLAVGHNLKLTQAECAK